MSELASKSPAELTTLFEQVSGSDEYKEQYETLEKEKRRAEEDQIYSYQKKKGLAQARCPKSDLWQDGCETSELRMHRRARR